MYKLYQVYNLLTKYNLPPYVKKATWGEITGSDEQIPNWLFADDKFKLYPCHTAAATIISAAQFNEDKNNYNKERRKYIEMRLRKHASELGIIADVEDILDHKEEVSIPYALEHDSRKLFPIRNPTEIKKLAEYLVEHYRDIPQEYREIAARNALKEAKAKNYDLGQAEVILEKLACDGIVDKRKFLDILQSAAKRASPSSMVTNETHSALCELIRGVINIPATNQELLRRAVKVASDIIPNILNLKQPIELDVVYHVSELKKEAQEVIRLANGSYFRKTDLLKIPNYAIRERFANYNLPVEINGVISHSLLFKAAQALSEEDAENFENSIQEYGIYPVVREAKGYTIPA